MDLLKRITNLRFTAFLVVCAEAGLLAWADKLHSDDLQMVLIAAIAAFIGAQAWESTRPPATTTTNATTNTGA